jgi:hypothetical protein
MLPRSLHCVLHRQQHSGRDDIFARLREAWVGLGLRGEEKDNAEAQRAQRKAKQIKGKRDSSLRGLRSE